MMDVFVAHLKLALVDGECDGVAKEAACKLLPVRPP